MSYRALSPHVQAGGAAGKAAAERKAAIIPKRGGRYSHWEVRNVGGELSVGGPVSTRKATPEDLKRMGR